MSFEDFKSGVGFLGLHYIVDPLLKVPPPIDLDVVVFIFTRNSTFQAILLVQEFLLIPSPMCLFSLNGDWSSRGEKANKFKSTHRLLPYGKKILFSADGAYARQVPGGMPFIPQHSAVASTLRTPISLMGRHAARLVRKCKVCGGAGR